MIEVWSICKAVRPRVVERKDFRREKEFARRASSSSVMSTVFAGTA